MSRSPAEPDSTARRTFHTLDGLRGLAAIGVVFYHFIRLSGPIRFPSAYLAVDLFFLMSGVVIAHLYEERLWAGLTVGRFLAIRLARLYPMYVLGLACAVAMSLLFRARHPLAWEWTVPQFTRTVVLNLFMLPSPVRMSGALELFPLNLVSWSLFWELIINLVYAACAVRLTNRLLIGVAGVAGALLVGLAIVLGNVDAGYDLPTLAGGPIRVTFSFVVGLMINRGHQAGWRLPFTVPAPLLLVITLLALTFDGTGAGRAMFDLCAVMIVFPLSVYAALENEPAAAKGVYTFLGVISYPLYMLHTQVLAVAESIASAAKVNLSRDAPYTGLAILSASIALSWLAVMVYDTPARRVAARLLSRLR